MIASSRPVVWLHGEIKTPPFSELARVQAGVLLRRVQDGELLSLPVSRPMPSVGPRCHELRIQDDTQSWRVMYRIDSDAILVLEVFAKATRATPQHVIDACKRRLVSYDRAAAGDLGQLGKKR